MSLAEVIEVSGRDHPKRDGPFREEVLERPKR
jgi:hypothetical protein